MSFADQLRANVATARLFVDTNSSIADDAAFQVVKSKCVTASNAGAKRAAFLRCDRNLVFTSRLVNRIENELKLTVRAGKTYMSEEPCWIVEWIGEHVEVVPLRYHYDMKLIHCLG